MRARCCNELLASDRGTLSITFEMRKAFSGFTSPTMLYLKKSNRNVAFQWEQAQSGSAKRNPSLYGLVVRHHGRNPMLRFPRVPPCTISQDKLRAKRGRGRLLGLGLGNLRQLGTCESRSRFGTVSSTWNVPGNPQPNILCPEDFGHLPEALLAHLNGILVESSSLLHPVEHSKAETKRSGAHGLSIG